MIVVREYMILTDEQIDLIKLNKVLNVQVSDTTGDATSTIACNIKMFLRYNIINHFSSCIG